MLRRIHDLGIWHGDLHAGNILVTPDDAVFVLDFASCQLSAPAWALYREQRLIADIFTDPDVSLVLHLCHSAASGRTGRCACL